MRIKLFVIPVENNDVDEEVGDDPSDSKHQESSDEKVFEDEGISKRKEECKGENPCQIDGETDLHWDCYFHF